MALMALVALYIVETPFSKHEISKKLQLLQPSIHNDGQEHIQQKEDHDNHEEPEPYSSPQHASRGHCRVTRSTSL